jgi:triosephosphate isomerase (TIM)
MRRYLIAGNWKMHKTIKEAVGLIEELKTELHQLRGADIAVCPPFTALSSAQETLEGSNIHLGAQNMYFENEGAYTGEESALILKDAGCRYVILGHSERRKIFGETDELINKKVKAALRYGLIPILCIGESLKERETEKTHQIITSQLDKDLKSIDEKEAQKIVIAYEPVWAIGTGKTATDQQAQSAHAFIRDCLKKRYSLETAEKIKILYGGSVKPDNIEGLIGQVDVDGALVGGASLDARSFSQIVKKSVKGVK